MNNEKKEIAKQLNEARELEKTREKESAADHDKKVGELKEQIQALQQEKEDLAKRCDESTAEVQKLKELHEKELAKIQKLQKSEQQLLKDNFNETVIQEEQLHELRQDKEDVVSKLNDETVKADVIFEQNHNLQAENEELKRAIAEKDEQLKALEKGAAAQEEVDTLKEETHAKESEIARLKEEIKSMKA